MLPTRFFLVTIESFSFVWKMKVVSINNALQLQLAYYQFLNPITKSIVDSMTANNSNEEYFKTLPLQMMWSQLLSLNETERVAITLFEVISQYNQNYNLPIQIKFPWITLRMFWSHWYALYIFIKYFNENYYALNQTIINNPKITTQPIIQIEEEVKEIKVEKEEEEEDYEIMLNMNTLTLMNDCLKMVPNNIIQYFLTKYINNYIKGMYLEKEYNIDIKNGSLIINIAPILDVQLIGLSNRHYRELLMMINSFHPLPDESISILNQLINQLLFMTNSNIDKDTLHLPLKVMEFLIFLYSIKHYNLDFLNQIPENSCNPLVFHNLMSNMVNYYIDHILKLHDLSNNKFQKIVFIHCQDSHFEKEIKDIDQLKEIISKERFMLDIDRQKFISLVQDQFTNIEKEKKQKIKLILYNPTILNLNDFINKENNLSLLNYNIIKPPQNLTNHTILTNEYLQLLRLVTATNITSYLIQQELSLLLTKYSDIILNKIFSDINTRLDKNSLINTLTILQEYIRPNIPKDATVLTELEILYKCIIPYLYDIYNIREIKDYFH